MIPVEIAETRYGVLVDQYAFHVTDAGAGRHRGGRGLVRDYRAVAEEVTVTATFGRHKYLPWGVEGGRDGSRNEVQFLHEDGREVVVGKSARYVLRRGEVARLITGTGGGWGHPFERPVEAVLEDVRDGIVTFEQAERDYGVVVNPETLEVDRLTPERRQYPAGASSPSV
jgi:N-methylhydantoinase B